MWGMSSLSERVVLNSQILLRGQWRGQGRTFLQGGEHLRTFSWTKMVIVYSWMTWYSVHFMYAHSTLRQQYLNWPLVKTKICRSFEADRLQLPKTTSCQLRTGNWGHILNIFTKISQKKMLPGQMRFDFCWDIPMVGSNFVVNNMKGWTHSTSYQWFSLIMI